MADLIERLREGCVEHPRRWSGDTHDDLGGSIDEAATDALLAEAADALEAAREDAWVACSERLPGPSEHVEVWPNDSDPTYNFYAHFDGGTNGVKAGNWYHNDRHGFDFVITPTHWRALPAPPKESSNG